MPGSQVSDVLITNFSSIANLFYATLSPTIHIYPVRSADEASIWRTLSVADGRNCDRIWEALNELVDA